MNDEIARRDRQVTGGDVPVWATNEADFRARVTGLTMHVISDGGVVGIHSAQFLAERNIDSNKILYTSKERS